MPKKFTGVEFTKELIANLPEKVDPCGENGKFHTFVYDGPIFKKAVAVEKGEVVLKDGFYFANIVSARA